MPRITSVLRTAATFAVSFSCACALGLFMLKSAAAQPSGDDVIYLDQGWSQADRERYYQISQGSNGDVVRHLPEPGGCRRPGTFPLGRQ